MIEIVAIGEDPQIRLTLRWWRLLLQDVSFGLWLALALMAYPLVIVMVRLCGGSADRCARGFSFADPLVLAGMGCWLLAGVYAVDREAFRKEVPVEGRKLVLYEKNLEARVFSLHRADGLEIAARVYTPGDGSAPHGALLFLHGNYPQGQLFPLYPPLARELADKGYMVLTIDFAGYGQSEDPFARSHPVQVDMESETEAALAWLGDTMPAFAGRIGIIGHSMGADPALRIGLDNPLVSTIMLIGPPRRVWERFHSPDRYFFWNWALQVGEKQYGRIGFPPWYSQRRWLEDILQRDMARKLLQLEGWRHKPLLLMDGGGEPGPDRIFLSAFAQQISYPKAYVTVAQADHNSNVQIHGGRIFYEPAVMEQTVEVLDHWYQQSVSGRVTVLDTWRNLLRWFFAACPLFGER